MARRVPLNKLKLIGIKGGQNGGKAHFLGGLDPEMRGEERV